MRALIVARALTNSQPTLQPTTYLWPVAGRLRGLAATIRRPIPPTHRQARRPIQGAYSCLDRAPRLFAGEADHHDDKLHPPCRAIR
jgi:hypothetical protein